MKKCIVSKFFYQNILRSVVPRINICYQNAITKYMKHKLCTRRIYQLSIALASKRFNLTNEPTKDSMISIFWYISIQIKMCWRMELYRNVGMHSAKLLPNMGTLDLMQIWKHSSYIVFHKGWNM